MNIKNNTASTVHCFNCKHSYRVSDYFQWSTLLGDTHEGLYKCHKCGSNKVKVLSTKIRIPKLKSSKSKWKKFYEWLLGPNHPFLKNK